MRQRKGNADADMRTRTPWMTSPLPEPPTKSEGLEVRSDRRSYAKRPSKCAADSRQRCTHPVVHVLEQLLGA